MDRSLVWFRRDLRVHDNPTLKDAIDNSDEILPLYVFDQSQYEQGMFDIDRIGGLRAEFLQDSVRDLRSNLQNLDGDLIIRSGSPRQIISDLCSEYNIKTVYTQTIPSTQELQRERNIRDAVETEFERYWTHTLYHINDLKSEYKNIDDTFTPWRKETQYNVDVRETVDRPNSMKLVSGIDRGKVPDLNTLGVTPKSPDSRAFVDFTGGETSGLERLQEYIWEKDKLRVYKETRNELLGEDYSSKFSPWLAHGNLSPRRIHDEVKKYENERVSNDSTYWLIFELMWRDYFQFQFMKYGSAFFTPTGIRDVDKEWNQDSELFQCWKDGETGIPFVDANMRELNETGYMSNRGRQNVASFLTDVLNTDWRMGAMYFQSKLVDYDVCSNWGNWAYQAGVGNDSRDGYFNVVKQGKRYDTNGEYIRHWLPVLDNLPSDATHEPWLMSDGQKQMYNVGDNYPEPIVDVDGYSYKELVDGNVETIHNP